ncbi:MAG: rhodanese-like domain-containing protein [Pseudomonadota bacterium]
MNFSTLTIFLAGVVALTGGALLWPALQPRGKRASALQVTQLINKGKTLILDVREPAEFEKGHLRDAKNIPLAELDKRIAELEKSKSRTIIVVCQSGTRADRAAVALGKAGFAEVVSLDGGIGAWTTAGLPLAKPGAAKSTVALDKK